MFVSRYLYPPVSLSAGIFIRRYLYPPVSLPAGVSVRTMPKCDDFRWPYAAGRSAMAEAPDRTPH
jgi:hypothetical protein